MPKYKVGDKFINNSYTSSMYAKGNLNERQWIKDRSGRLINKDIAINEIGIITEAVDRNTHIEMMIYFPKIDICESMTEWMLDKNFTKVKPNYSKIWRTIVL